MIYKLTYRQFSEGSILVEWPQDIDLDILRDVLLFKIHLEKYYIKQRVYINNAYNSILISYSYTIDNVYDVFLNLKQEYSNLKKTHRTESKLWKVPVCYDEKFGIDLDAISLNNGLAISALIRLHLKPIYTIYFIGFLPGFLYLGGLDERIAFPRKEKPRKNIKKGSVAIGGNQTGIYPNASPAGWNIIGNCPLNLFDITKKNPCFALPGDRVQFYEINTREHILISDAVKNNTYNMQNELIDG